VTLSVAPSDPIHIRGRPRSCPSCGSSRAAAAATNMVHGHYVCASRVQRAGGMYARARLYLQCVFHGHAEKSDRGPINRRRLKQLEVLLASG
jgi:hypothetical protein